MSHKTDSTGQEIINELTDIEYDEDDALTLLDDEEMQSSNDILEDEDLSSFYLDYPEGPATINGKVDLYTEEIVEEDFKLEDNVVSDESVSISDKKQIDIAESSDETTRYQNPVNSISNNNVDAYLYGALENKQKEGVIVEKMESVVVPSIVKEEPIYNKLIEQRPSYNVEPVKTDGIDLGNLNQLFAKVEDNVKGASDIVNRNAEIKKKIDERYEELQRLQAEHEQNKKNDYAEINAYKDDVYNKLKAKKVEIEEQLTALKTEQSLFEREKINLESDKEKMRIEKESFEKTRSEYLISISQKEKELHDTYEERVKNIEQVENGLIKRKEQLDIEKEAISKDRAQCEVDKKELAENLVKFNKLVDNFTKGVDKFNETN